MIGRQSLIIISVRLSNTIKEINVLNLPLSPKDLFKIVKRNKGIIINSNKSAVSKNGL
jgi:hypothetical protein